MFCKSGILIFIFAENNYSIYAHAMLIKTPLLHQSLGPRVFLSFSLSLFLANCLERRGRLSSLSCPGFWDPLKKAHCAFTHSRGRPVPTCSSASPENRTLLAFRVNQGTSASFSLSLSRPPGSSPLKDQQYIVYIERWHHFVNIGPSSQSYCFSSSLVWMWELDHKEEGWVPKNWCFQIVVLEKTIESPLDSMEIKPVNPKGNQSPSLEGLMLKLNLQYFGNLMQTADSLEKTLMLGKIEGRRRKGQQRKRWLDRITDRSLSNLREMVREREAWHAADHAVARSWT